jgi:antitoxin FitA
MPNIQIKDVPERTHSVLRQRAAAAHQSLQEYLLTKLVREADQPTMNELLDAVATQKGGALTLVQAAAMVREDRDRR